VRSVSPHIQRNGCGLAQLRNNAAECIPTLSEMKKPRALIAGKPWLDVFCPGARDRQTPDGGAARGRLRRDPRREAQRDHDRRARGTAHGARILRKGDVLMVTRIDRLARSIGDLQDIVRTIRARGAALKATEQPIDTGTAAGKCFLDMLGVFAEFETNLRCERQLEGIARPRPLASTWGGRPQLTPPRCVK
jgi:hypothetical protein